MCFALATNIIRILKVASSLCFTARAWRRIGHTTRYSPYGVSPHTVPSSSSLTPPLCFPMSAARSSAFVVHRWPSSSLMVSSRSSPLVLILGCPRRALSRVRFVSPCPPLAPLPPPCVGAYLTRPWCPRAHRSGRCTSSSLMVPLPSSSMVGFCDGRALVRADNQRLNVRLGWHHVWRVQLARSPSPGLSRRPCLASCNTCASSCSDPTVWSGPSQLEIYLVLSIPLFLLALAAKVYNNSAIPSVYAGVTVHTALQSCVCPQSSSWPSSAYLYVCFFSFPSPFPFPSHLPAWLSSFLSWSLCFLQVNCRCCK
jgi:hypothetical protein